MNRHQSATVIGLGELLWDCFPDGRKPGGAPANVAFHATQLGCKGVVCSRIGNDEDGRELLAFLIEKELSCEGVQQDSLHQTGKVLITMEQADHPRYEICERVAWDFLSWTKELQELILSADAICFGTLAQRSDQSRKTVHRALETASSDTVLVYDLNLRQHYFHRDWVRKSLQLADILKLNEEEAERLPNLLEIDPVSQEELPAWLLDTFGLTEVIVTYGDDGCLMTNTRESVREHGLTVPLADAVGAGDAFTAGTIFGYLQQWELRKRAAFSCEVGGLVASHHGAMPELQDEYASIIERYER